ncbi:hypothetical protein Back11_23970 [Paenibacillus baekrokdamisoli]|uniref:Uncharacterized protein n=1 Tax=Paenibacillus baekrokdamisoli TaxID=1712516 RepID=A0A3G9IRX3_9BACL|nr:DUF4395 domain-containing protein [Paenibacillus baekrokdamisoli]MBB3069593.1 phosphatidylglycerophosphate synthase [Paenibacillus baekrokdamisoli]BBH21052.1 hypothetical protein Back11_23970 [Paenibacillus baekrokdamisoli]
MKEVPIIYVKANQTGIILFVILSLLLQQPWLLAVLWIIQAAGLLTKGKGNLFVSLAKTFLHPSSGSEMQAVELQRFNNILAVIFLSFALGGFALDLRIVGTAFALMLVAAAGAAPLGYCVGCTIYFQYKQFIARRRLS